MRLQISESKNSKSYYMVKSVFENGRHSSRVVEKLGTHTELLKEHADPLAWAQEYVRIKTEEEKEDNNQVMVSLSPTHQIKEKEQSTYNVGYLFLEKIFYDLKIDKICESISRKCKFTYDLTDVLSRLIYSRIIYPTSKLSTLELSKNYVEQPNFDLQHIYRSLDVIAENEDYIQSQLYKNSKEYSKRNDGVLFYDCTNFFFEMEHPSGLKQYGMSKEHRPNPIVQMGLFMDGDGIPLSFCINPGNTNEQLTLQPLEKKILQDFGHSKFIVCTDAGLSSASNRRFNDVQNRAFVTTQSLKSIKEYLKKWVFEDTGWKQVGTNKEITRTEIDNDEYLYWDKLFYKERYIVENGVEQKLIVTYSLQYRYYQEDHREHQIERAKNLISNPSRLNRSNDRDCQRFIKKTSLTKNGEIAEETKYAINQELIDNDAQYDGLYAICTNLDDPSDRIAKIAKSRWEIEECFRIMKTEFKARPVYLSNDKRIKAHFMTCFLALTLYRYLEKKLENKYTCSKIIKGLKDMNMCKVKTEGYMPIYSRTELTDKLHEKFGFRTDFEIIKTKEMKNILRKIKNK